MSRTQLLDELQFPTAFHFTLYKDITIEELA